MEIQTVLYVCVRNVYLMENKVAIVLLQFFDNSEWIYTVQVKMYLCDFFST